MHVARREVNAEREVTGDVNLPPECPHSDEHRPVPVGHAPQLQRLRRLGHRRVGLVNPPLRALAAAHLSS